MTTSGSKYWSKCDVKTSKPLHTLRIVCDTGEIGDILGLADELLKLKKIYIIFCIFIDSVFFNEGNLIFRILQ